MRAKELLKRYPEEWATIEASVWDNMNYQFRTAKIEDTDIFGKKRRAVAYNAAFMAVSLLRKPQMKIKKGKAR